MAEPIIWTIQSSIATALGNINGSGGYFFTATTVAHRESNAQQVARGTFVVGLASIAREDISALYNKYQWNATFSIVGIVAPSTAGLPDDQLRARLWADIQRAVMADPRRTVSTVEYAIDTQIIDCSITDNYDERVGVTVTIGVQYRTSITDPTSL